MAYFRSDSLAWDMKRYDNYEASMDMAYERMRQALIEEYYELLAEKSDYIRDDRYEPDDECYKEFISVDEYIDKEESRLDIEDYLY